MIWPVIGTILMHITVAEGNAGVNFITQPHDINIVVGEDAFFPCTYNGSDIAPTWNVNGQIISSSDIGLYLSKHRFNGTGLIVQNTDLSHHLWHYSCFVTVYSQDSRTFVNYQSSTGTLHIYQAGLVTSSNSGEVTSVITAPFSSSVKLKVTKQESKISTSITDVLLLSNVTIMNSAPSYGIYIGTAASGISVVIIAFITTVLIIMKKKVAPKLEKERIPARVDLEPVYEEVLPDTNANPCYEVVHPKVNIEMSGNTAYTILTK